VNSRRRIPSGGHKWAAARASDCFRTVGRTQVRGEKDTLSAALLIEISIGGLGLLKPIGVGEKRIDIGSALAARGSGSTL